jgi:hypothetical protein
MYAFTEEDLTELLGDDLTLAASLAKLINEKGDIRAFLVKKLEERLEQEEEENEVDDWNAFQDSVDAREAQYINQNIFG